MHIAEDYFILVKNIHSRLIKRHYVGNSKWFQSLLEPKPSLSSIFSKRRWKSISKELGLIISVGKYGEKGLDWYRKIWSVFGNQIFLRNTAKLTVLGRIKIRIRSGYTDLTVAVRDKGCPSASMFLRVNEVPCSINLILIMMWGPPFLKKAKPGHRSSSRPKSIALPKLGSMKLFFVSKHGKVTRRSEILVEWRVKIKVWFKCTKLNGYYVEQ